MRTIETGKRPLNQIHYATFTFPQTLSTKHVGCAAFLRDLRALCGLGKRSF